MTEQSGIAWTDDSYAPWFGCTKVSPGCDGCYAEQRVAKRFHLAGWGPHEPRARKAASTRNEPLAWNRKAAADTARRRVFCSHYSDVFDNHSSIQDEWRADLWGLIHRTGNLDWQLLSKRPQNFARYLPPDWGDGWPNVWLGVTAENMAEATRRIPILLETPARVRWLSCEPLLEPLDLTPWLPSLDWIVVGGESSQGQHAARPMDLGWARALRGQCAAHGVRFFMKQLSQFGISGRAKLDDPAVFPSDLRVREYPSPRLRSSDS